MTFAEIDRLLARGDCREACIALAQRHAAAPADREVLARFIDALLAAGEPHRALEGARSLLALDPADLDSRFYLCKTEYAAGNLAVATELIAALERSAAAQSAVFQLLKGNLYAALGSWVVARQAFAAATVLDPGYAEAFDRRGAAARETGDLAAAAAAWQRYAELTPADPRSWFQLGAIRYANGELDPAIEAYQRALAVDRDALAAWRGLGVLFAETFRFDDARKCLERVLQLSPGDEGAIDLLGVVLAEMGETARAKEVLAQPAAVQPALARRVREALLLPQVYDSLAAVGRYRQGYDHGLATLEAMAESAGMNPAETLSLAQSNFLLAYQAGDDRDLQTRYADWLRRAIGAARPELLAPPGPRQGGKRIRVVYVSSFFRQCTIGNYFRSWVTALDPLRFERIVIHTGWQPDAFGDDLARHADRFVLARGNAAQVAALIRAENADILIYPEIGMGAQNYLLANMRLARVQCAAWGHPVSSGSAEIDYYFSCAAMEPVDAASHYRENLLLLPGIGTAYAAPAGAPAALTRTVLGLTEAQRVYVCPQSLFKIHPANDAAYLDIIAADDNAVLLFFQATAPAIGRAFAARLSRAMAARGIPARGQMKFLPRQNEAGFRALLALADVVLDTFGWSGGNTSLDALAVGAPIVTLPGRFMRGRQTQAMLTALDQTSLIARDHADYVAKAQALARDRGRQQEIRRAILAARGALFDRAEPITQLAAHLVALHEQNN